MKLNVAPGLEGKNKRQRAEHEDEEPDVHELSMGELSGCQRILKSLRGLKTFDNVKLTVLDGNVADAIASTRNRSVFLHFHFDHKRASKKSICRMQIEGSGFKYQFRSRVAQICAKSGPALKAVAQKDQYDELDYTDLKLVSIYDDMKKSFEPDTKKTKAVPDSDNDADPESAEHVSVSFPESEANEPEAPAKIIKVNPDASYLAEVVTALKKRWTPVVMNKIHTELVANEKFMSDVRDLIRADIEKKEGDAMRKAIEKKIEEEARRLHIDLQKPLSAQELLVINNILAAQATK